MQLDCGDKRQQIKAAGNRKLWQRAMLEMSNNTRDLVMRATKRYGCELPLKRLSVV